MTGGVQRWPLFLIAAPAAVSIWSGWVGLGGMCGFGTVHPLPGIVPGFQLDTAITLPIGVEAYGAYALGAWLSPGVPGTARKFARRSAIGALLLGHARPGRLSSARGSARTPSTVASHGPGGLPARCDAGFGAALTHLLGAPEPQADTAPETSPEPSAVPAPNPPARRTRARSRTAPGNRTRSAPVTETDAELHYAPDLAAGAIPSQRRIRADLRVGQNRARVLRTHLESVVTS